MCPKSKINFRLSTPYRIEYVLSNMRAWETLSGIVSSTIWSTLTLHANHNEARRLQEAQTSTWITSRRVEVQAER